MRCTRAVGEAYPGHEVQEFNEQGGCSYTLLVSPSAKQPTTTDHGDCLEDDRTIKNKSRKSFIVQVRPAQYALNLDMVQVARATYPLLAPDIRALELLLSSHLHAYEMEKMSGTSLSPLLPRIATLDAGTQRKQERLIESFAAFVAQGWPPASSRQQLGRIARADSPMEDESRILSRCTGKVGSSITPRLEKLVDQLPDSSLRQRAASVLRRVRTMSDYPVMLNHGDLIPSNILIDEDTWEITGVVDWAEAEYLPFGTCLYGLEPLLGYFTAASPAASQSEDNSHLCSDPVYTYYENAIHLRNLFWSHLTEKAPGSMKREDDVKMMRDMGVLLWYGYAWDDGAINRVVNFIDDAKEVACLRAFLDAA